MLWWLTERVSEFAVSRQEKQTNSFRSSLPQFPPATCRPPPTYERRPHQHCSAPLCSAAEGSTGSVRRAAYRGRGSSRHPLACGGTRATVSDIVQLPVRRAEWLALAVQERGLRAREGCAHRCVRLWPGQQERPQAGAPPTPSCATATTRPLPTRSSWTPIPDTRPTGERAKVGELGQGCGREDRASVRSGRTAA